MFNKKSNREINSELDLLIGELKKGSAEAFHILYDKYQNRIYRFCLKMLGDENAARDAFQETFVKLYEKSNTFRGENFTSWLYTIARHTCYNVIRARKEFETFDDVAHSKIETKHTDVALKEAIQKAINKLPESYKESFILREYEEFSYQEIAESLEIEVSLAKVRVHRARNLLRKLLQPVVKEINESR